MFIDDLVKRVIALSREKGWTSYRLAKEAGLHVNTLRHFPNDNWNPTKATLEQLEGVLAREDAATNEPKSGEAA